MQPNGHSSLPPPSLTDLVLWELRAIRGEIGDVRQGMGELKGGLKAGLKRSFENDRELFDQMREVRDRLTTIEMRPPAPGPPPRARRGLRQVTTWLADMVPPIRDIVVSLAAIALAAGIVAPERVPGLQGALAALKLSAP